MIGSQFLTFDLNMHNILLERVYLHNHELITAIVITNCFNPNIQDISEGLPIIQDSSQVLSLKVVTCKYNIDTSYYCTLTVSFFPTIQPETRVHLPDFPVPNQAVYLLCIGSNTDTVQK